MVFYASAMDDEPPSSITFKKIYYDERDLRQDEFLFFDFNVHYTRIPEVNSDGEEEDLSNLETKTDSSTLQFEKEWLFGGDKDYIQSVVCHILDLIEVPSYSDLVSRFADKILKLKKREAISQLGNVKKIKIWIDVFAESFPGDEDDDMDVGVDVDVRPAVAPASDEAMETHLETVVVNTEGYCVICLETILVGSNVEAGRMPCQHVFHRVCGEEWLRNSGRCPVCRYVLPS